MGRRRVLLSEGSSLTAREFVTVLRRSDVDVELVSASSLAIARFSLSCRAVHRVVAPSVDPVGYLQAVDALMATGRFDALLPTHEQGWLFSVGRDLLPHARLAVASPAAFDSVISKIGFAQVGDAIGLSQPRWREVRNESDLASLGFPVWLKASFSTSGRGVGMARDHRQAVEVWTALAASGGPVMVQAPAPGRYAQVQGLFDHGRLCAVAASELLATGAGGSAAARVSVDHPRAVAALARLGEHLDWDGGIGLDYFHENGVPHFIECNPRISEPGNAAAAGVDFAALMTVLARDRSMLPMGVVSGRAGVRTRSTMAIALGAAEATGTRRGIVSAVGRGLGRRGSLAGSKEVLTPVRADGFSAIPFVVATGAVLLRPSNVHRLAGDAVADYGVSPDAIARLRVTLGSSGGG